MQQTQVKSGLTKFEKPEKVEILSTMDYSMFSLVKGNRVIKKSHVKHLVDSITKKNLLKYAPIIINKDMQIADGQHRWLAAQELGVQIYYIIANDIEFADIVLLNNAVETWLPADFLEHFVDQGQADYISLAQFVNEWKFSVSNAIAVMSIGHDKYFKAPMRQFKTGEWQITDKAKAQWFAKAYTEISAFSEERTAKDRDLMRAVYRMYFVLDLGIIHEDFMEQLKKYPYPIYRRLGMKEYIRQLEDIYNFGRKSPIRFL